MIKLSSDFVNLKQTKGVFHKFALEKGKNCQILFLPLDSETSHVNLDIANPIRFSAECLLYPILNPLGTCVGSLFYVNKKRINFDPRFVFIRETENFSNSVCKQQTGLGGVNVYQDEDLNILISPHSPIITNLVVLE